MRVNTVTCGALVDDADGISTSQTPAAGGSQNLTITGALASGGSVTLAGAAQRVSVTSVGDDTGRTFTITGTDPDGTAITEAITGANAGAASGARYFQTITVVNTDDNTAGAVTVGVLKANGGIGATVDGNFGEFGSDYKPGVIVSQTGTATWSMEVTGEKVTGTYTNGYANDANFVAESAFSGKTAAVASTMSVPCHGVRIRITSWTSGTVEAQITTPEPSPED